MVQLKLLLLVVHVFLEVLGLSHFFIEFIFDLSNDSDSLVIGSYLILYLVEDHSQAVSEVDQVFVHLCTLVKGDHLLRVVGDRHHQ